MNLRRIPILSGFSFSVIGIAVTGVLFYSVLVQLKPRASVDSAATWVDGSIAYVGAHSGRGNGIFDIRSAREVTNKGKITNIHFENVVIDDDALGLVLRGSSPQGVICTKCALSPSNIRVLRDSGCVIRVLLVHCILTDATIAEMSHWQKLATLEFVIDTQLDQKSRYQELNVCLPNCRVSL